MKRAYPMTEWGLRATTFRLRHAMTVNELCSNAGVSVASYQAVAIGKHSGAKTIALVEKYMDEYEKALQTLASA